MSVIALDPGVTKGVGQAYFGGGVLRGARLGPLEDAVARISHGFKSRVVIECPRIYPRSRTPGDGNDLLQLARVVGRLEQAALSAGFFVQVIEPRDWAGSLKHEAMVARIWAELKPVERDQIEWPVRFNPEKLPKRGSLNDDVMSAIGIGLHAVGRLEPRKVFPR
jgi:hypothetical protein